MLVVTFAGGDCFVLRESGKQPSAEEVEQIADAVSTRTGIPTLRADASP